MNNDTHYCMTYKPNPHAYDSIYVLAEPATYHHSADTDSFKMRFNSKLRGRIFRMVTDEDERFIYSIPSKKIKFISFIDLITNEVLVENLEVSDIKFSESDDIYIFGKSGVEYHIIPLHTLIPIADISTVESAIELNKNSEPNNNCKSDDNYESNNLSQSLPPLEVIHKNFNTKSADLLQDGYTTITYIFNRNIDEDEFRDFCKIEGLSLIPQRVSERNFNIIFGNNNIWTWFHTVRLIDPS